QYYCECLILSINLIAVIFEQLRLLEKCTGGMPLHDQENLLMFKLEITNSLEKEMRSLPKTRGKTKEKIQLLEEVQEILGRLSLFKQAGMESLLFQGDLEP